MNKVNNRVTLAISEGSKASLNIRQRTEKYKRCESHQGWRSGPSASLTDGPLGVRGWKVIRIKKQSIKGLLADPKPSSWSDIIAVVRQTAKTITQWWDLGIKRSTDLKETCITTATSVNKRFYFGQINRSA